MTLLREEPRLLTVKFRECNVLHLGVRNNWYGLVQEILQKFNHLYNDASSETHGASASPSSDSVESVFNPDLFRDLLVAKEGGAEPASSAEFEDEKVYASGLDVFAMAVIQGHGAIDTILAEAVSKVDGLFDSRHPHKKVFRRRSNRSTNKFGPADLTLHERERKMLREIILECFPTKRSTERLDVSSNIRATDHEEEIATESQGPPGCIPDPNVMDRLQDKISSTWTGKWQLTSPFLPLEEFLFLACCFKAWTEDSDYSYTPGGPRRGTYRNTSTLSKMNEVLRCCARRENDVSFMEYLLAIDDTWGTAIHHCIHSHVGFPQHETPVSDGLRLLLSMRPFQGSRDDKRCIEVIKALHTALALGKLQSAGTLLEHVLADGRAVGQDAWFRNLQFRADSNPSRRWPALSISRRKRNVQWGVRGISPNTINLNDKGEWQIDVETVSAVNGYLPRGVSGWVESSSFHYILRSPHLSDSTREIGTKLLLSNSVSLNTGACCQCLIDNKICWVTPMQLAACVGDGTTLQLLASDDRVYDRARINNLSMAETKETLYLPSCRGGWDYFKDDRSALHIAAIVGNPQAIRIILTSGKFDPLAVEPSRGKTAVHFATPFEFPLRNHFSHFLGDFFRIPDERVGTRYNADSSLSDEKRVETEESRRQSCINLLLQAGIDIWQTDKNNQVADPGPKASPNYSKWWYEKLGKETQEAKSSLNAAANAISVTGALVATASFVGPLQPPLGYAARNEGQIATMQVDVPAVRIFIVCDMIAFYLALVAIMLSLTPSLPMPQESMLDELKLMRRTVALAVAILSLAIVAILSAFASASIAVISSDESGHPGGITTIIMFIGGFFCALVLVFCIGFRLLRFAFPKNNFVRRLYRKYLCI